MPETRDDCPTCGTEGSRLGEIHIPTTYMEHEFGDVYSQVAEVRAILDRGSSARPFDNDRWNNHLAVDTVVIGPQNQRSQRSRQFTLAAFSTDLVFNWDDAPPPELEERPVLEDPRDPGPAPHPFPGTRIVRRGRPWRGGRQPAEGETWRGRNDSDLPDAGRPPSVSRLRCDIAYYRYILLTFWRRHIITLYHSFGPGEPARDEVAAAFRSYRDDVQSDLNTLMREGRFPAGFVESAASVAAAENWSCPAECPNMDVRVIGTRFDVSGMSATISGRVVSPRIAAAEVPGADGVTWYMIVTVSISIQLRGRLDFMITCSD
jgi:hypothetical protein